ncbi:hypothetical protein BN938_2452 [Mucinivorans hirudinis]|uniref:Uncharacterized protein n=1 Tax=Mucinivorans hirudinis TaxID=1433126 RepID=A0A060RAA7_9BACT|nr:hypothetical protein BN938_2452 [Mucinivorans hirudinis]
MFNNLHTLWGSILAQNLAPPKPYTIYAPETKTTDPIEKTHKKNVGFTKRQKEWKLNSLTS